MEGNSFFLRVIGGKPLQKEFIVGIEPDEEFWLATCSEVPQIYGFGETQEKAFEMFERDINSLYKELMEDNNWPSDYLLTKRMLSENTDG